MAESLIFDHYEVLRREDGSLHELGRGAMGTTFKAFDTNLRVPVALKVINAAFLESEVARLRFVREARSAAQLRHRNVASVFHLGTGEGAFFYAMEFIDGETVDARIRREGALEPVLALNIAAQVARALGAAERLGLVHRDIKPSNLMLVHEDDELVVKVIDFGLAKSVSPDEEAVTMTQSGFVGTPHFASPEQLDERETDVRSDLYSLGATLWYMLAGRAPFAGSLAQVMSQHLHKPPPFELFPQWPAAVIGVLQRLLEKEVEQRFQTPGEAREALEQGIATLTGAAVQEFPTLIETPAAADDEFAAGQKIGGKYEVLEALGESTLGLVYRVKGSSEEMLRLTALSGDLGPAELADFQAQVRIAAGVEDAHLLTPLGVEIFAQRGWLAEQWTHGFTLAELLRARRELPPAEVLALVKQAAKGVDTAIARELEHLPLSLPETFLDFADERDVDEKTPFASWPDFVVKLRCVQVVRTLADSATWAGEQTLVSASAPALAVPQSLAARYVQALSALAYELLGGQALAGAIAGGAAFRYVPLANLSEQGNEVLKRGLDPARSYASAAEWMQALAAAEVDRVMAKPAVLARTEDPRVKRIAAPALEVRRVAAGEPAKRSGAGPLVMGALVLMLGAVAVFWLMPTKRVPPVAQSTPSPAAEPIPTASAVPATPTPVLAPTRDERMRTALDSAKAAEASGDWARALTAYLQLARDFPEQEVQLELLTSKLRGEALTPTQFAPLQTPITEAAKRGVVSAMMLLGDHLRKTDPAAAFAWFSSAAAQGKPEAMTKAGEIVANDRLFGEAVKWFQWAADAGDAAGTRNLAECFLLGKGTSADVPKGMELLQKAAGMNDARAMDRLATRVSHGDGIAQDFQEAIRLYSQARDLGYLDAQGNLGVMVLNGDAKTPPDSRRAFSLFESGAAKGNAYCMFLLARCYESGTAVTANRGTATTWYQRAAAAGNAGAIAWCRSNKAEVPATP